MDALKDEDLNFKPEHLPSIGETCIQIGEWQHAYVDGFKTFKQDFEYRNSDAELIKSVKMLRTWYEKMDAEIETAIDAMSDNDVTNRGIDRGGWEASVEWNLRIWQECLIIFYTKMMVNFELMDKELPEGVARWIQ